LFGGYNRYFWARRLWNSIRWMPNGARVNVARVLSGPARGVFAGSVNALRPLTPTSLRVQNPGDKLQKVAEILALKSPDDLYLQLVSHWKRPFDVVIGAQERPTELESLSEGEHFKSFVHRMMYLDTVTYLPDDILVKVDRATMAVSLEGRAPLLDYRAYEFAWRLPLSMKIRGGNGKWILRKVLERYLPPSLFDRPKMGFGVPIVSWLRGPLRDWAEALLDERRLREEGFFNAAPIREKWEEHQKGTRDWHYYLWDVLMFQAWLEHSRTTSATALPRELAPSVEVR
jgi:asparagine synthase (glutamine-hydrolysing)